MKTSHLTRWMMCAITAAGLARPLVAQDRVALLVSNWDYPTGKLSDSRREIERLGQVLETAGFAVTIKENVTDFRRALEQFNLACPDGGLSLFFYSGYANRSERQVSRTITRSDGTQHKLESKEVVAGLLPAGKTPTRIYALADVARSFKERSAARLHLIFLDCARANPGLDKAEWQGPGQVPAALFPSAMLCTAASAGQTLAANRPNRPSLLISSVTRHVTSKGIPLGNVMANIRDEVATASGGKQRPWFDFSLAKDATAYAISNSQRPVSTDKLPPAKPRAGDQWINGQGMVFCWCPPGSFRMGLADASKPQTRDARQVDVTISEGFWMGKHEVTNAAYFKMRKKTGHRSSLVKHANVPITFINGPRARGFRKSLVDLEGKAGRIPAGWDYRLPTEAEWEYACRAGTTTGYSFGDKTADLHRYANYADAQLYAADDSFYYADRQHDDGVGLRPAAVGSFKPNAWGIHDMHGNVSEYCVDSYFPRLPGGTNPWPMDKKGGIVHRGGSWCSTAEYCLAGFRNGRVLSNNDQGTTHVGLRLVLTRIRQPEKTK